MHIALPAFHFAPASPVRTAPAPGALHELQKGATLVIERPAGVELKCLCGNVWITHDGDPRDVVLSPGGSYRADRDSRMLVHALEPALICRRPFQG